MRATGKTTTCTEKESTPGKMAENTTATTTWTKSTDMEFTTGRTDVNMKACGKMENKAGKASTLLLMAESEGASGRMARE